MDLQSVETYLRLTHLAEVTGWQADWAWLAGGTWMFSQTQPQVKTLVDMQGLGWSELEVTPAGLAIGATCVMSQLLRFAYPATWPAMKGLQCAVHELASFKIQNVATVAGNLCLALPASAFAPVMVALGASYDISSLEGGSYRVAALDFQIGAKRTILKPGEVLRRIWISQESLTWRVNYRRICVATAGLAVSIVVAAHNPKTGQVRFGIGASVASPRLIEATAVPALTDLRDILEAAIPLTDFLEDSQASALYRRHVTQILMQRALAELGIGS